MRRVVAEVDSELQLRGLVGSQAEVARDRVFEIRAAPLHDAREVADGAVGDREGRAVVTDRHRDYGGLVVALARRSDGAQQGEGLQIDGRDIDARLLAGRDIAVDRVAVRGGEDDAAQRCPASLTPSETTW